MPRKTSGQGSSKAQNPKPPRQPSAAEAAADLEARREVERRGLVETLAGYGMPLEDLGLLLVPPLSKVEVEKRYAVEIEQGVAKAKAQLVQGLWRNALDKGNASAQIYLHKQMEREEEKRQAARAPSGTEPPAEVVTEGNVIAPAQFHRTFKSAAPK